MVWAQHNEIVGGIPRMAEQLSGLLSAFLASKRKLRLRASGGGARLVMTSARARRSGLVSGG